MYGNCPATPWRAMAMAGFLTAALVARAADTPQFQPVQARTEVQAPNYSPTPDDYKRLQSVAPEVVTMHVTSVSTQAAVTENNTPGALLVTAQAVVTGVVRSATNLTIGSTVYLVYGYVPSAPGAPAPPPTPVLIKNKDYRAYLTGGPGKTPYSPAAGAQSYVDPSTPLAANDGPSAATAKPLGPLADPSLLPTPENPNPAGSVRLRGAQLDQLVKLVQHDKRWAVTIAESDPVPLQMLGNAKPVLVVFYGIPLRAPLTQPAVLIYQAGTLPAPAPAKGNVTIERALVLDSDYHALGDALWAQRVEDNMRPIPLPLWHWAEYKVDVEDPATHQVQTILFTPPAAAPAKSAQP